MKRYSKKHARKSLFHTAAFRTLSQLSTFASFAVLVRSMSEHEFGVLQLLYAVIPLISTAASLGIEQTLRRYQPEYLQSGRAHVAAWLVRIASGARLATNILVLGAILLSWNWIAPLFQLAPYRGEFSLFCLLILMHFQVSILQLALSSHMMQGYSVGGTVVLSVTKLVAYLILSKLGLLTLTNAILADMVGYGLMYGVLRFAYARHCRLAPSGEPVKLEKSERQRLLRYSFYNNFNDAGTLLLTSKSDNFFIAALMSPVAVGAYAFYVRLNEMTSQILPTRQFSNVIQPLFFSVPVAEAAVKIPRYFTFLMNLTLLFQWPIVVYLTAYHAEIVTALFKGKFLDVSWLLALIAALSTLNRIADPVMLVAQYREKASIILLSKVFGIYNAIAMLALVPFAGVYGAAIATGTAQAMKNFFVWWYVRDMARWTNARAVLSVTALVWGGALAACYGLKIFLNAPPLVDLACGALVCAVAVLIYLRTPALSSDDRQILASIFHGHEGRLLRWLRIAPQGGAR